MSSLNDSNTARRTVEQSIWKAKVQTSLLRSWDFFEDILPPEVAEIVFSFLSLEDIVYVSLVCKTWNNYFDTKDIWRKIIEHYYGEISPRSVDLSQPFRWKRTFIILHNAHSWAKTLKNTTMTYKSSYDTPERATMGASGQFIHTPTSWISIKMAGKLVQVKRDPLTIDDKKWIPTSTGAVDLPILASHNGKYLIAKDYYRRYFLYDGEKLASMDVGDYSATQLQISYGTGIYRHLPSISFPNASFNSRFVVMANRTLYNASGGDVYHAVFDLKSECGCIQPQYKDAQKNRFHIIKHLQCNEYAINTKYGARGLFVSQEVLDLFVFFVNELDEEKSNASYSRYVFYPKMVIWKHGKGWQEEKTVHFKKCALVTDITNISEHIIDEHHWICFDMGNVYETRIIDLNNTSNQFKLDQISQRLWIPKKNKLILASGTKITVFDLTLKRWTSRITCQSDVRAMTLSKTARILFVADNRFVHAYHWETGKLVGSVSHWQHHSYPVIETIHIGYDQVIILNGKLFLKMPAKCDM